MELPTGTNLVHLAIDLFRASPHAMEQPARRHEFRRVTPDPGPAAALEPGRGGRRSTSTPSGSLGRPRLHRGRTGPRAPRTTASTQRPWTARRCAAWCWTRSIRSAARTARWTRSSSAGWRRSCWRTPPRSIWTRTATWWTARASTGWWSCSAPPHRWPRWTTGWPSSDPDKHRILGPRVRDLLLRFPNVVLWVNGHTHVNAVTLHARHPESRGARRLLGAEHGLAHRLAAAGAAGRAGATTGTARSRSSARSSTTPGPSSRPGRWTPRWSWPDSPASSASTTGSSGRGRSPARTAVAERGAGPQCGTAAARRRSEDLTGPLSDWLGGGRDSAEAVVRSALVGRAQSPRERDDGHSVGG